MKETAISSRRALKLRWEAADIAKFAMSLEVLILHTNMFGENTVGIVPVLRTAVPLFFMISSYLFFRGLEGAESDRRDSAICTMLGHYVLRTAKLYLFWFLVLLIPTAILRDWFKMSFCEMLLSVAFRVTFSSTFIASWYLSASVIALALIVALRYKLLLSMKRLLFIGIGLYGISLLFGPYSWVFGERASIAFKDVITHWAPYNSFPVAFFWMLMGYFTVRYEKRLSQIGTAKLLAVCAVGLVLVYVERATICLVDPSKALADVFVFLPVACVPAMILLLRSKAQIDEGYSSNLRRTSTIIYCLHGTLSAGLREVIGEIFPLFKIGLVNGAVTLGISLVVAGVILRLSRLQRFKWLRFAW